MEIHSKISDDSAQNSATTCEHMKNSIHWMYEDIYFIKGVIIYDNKDVCKKQYIC